MIAYNPLWLHNLSIQEQASKAFHHNYLAEEELRNINSKYTDHFYSPNFFIRIGLFVLTTVILLFTFGLFALIFLTSIENAIGGIAVFFALLSYALLEYMVRTKNHFQSGVDDALLWISAISLFGGISYLTSAGELANCVLVFIIALYSSLRFADRLMCIVLYISLLGIFFFTFIKLGPAAKALVPFLTMAVSGLLYLVATRVKKLKISWLYFNCLTVISISALLGFYISGNYYVVRELSISMFNLNLKANEPIPLGWFFWMFTLAVPCFYLAWGIQKKDIVLIRVGLLLVAAGVLTIRYYYSVVDVEIIMTIAGILLMIISYGLNRYLKFPKLGFTSLEDDPGAAGEKLKIESILLAQTFGASQPSAVDGTSFGGGSFGGGGSSGEF